MKITPKYPVYVPSAGRFESCYTAKFLLEDGTPFRLVVQPKEKDEYAGRFGTERILTLPWNNDGRTRDGLIKARNWIKAHSISEGHERHWQLDDNILCLERRWNTRRIRCDSGIALRCVEDFVDRYENVAVAGLNYSFFVPDLHKRVPFRTNVHVYSCSLILNSIPYGWRLNYNDDTDLCLQVLSNGWCTVLVNVFLAKKMRTMVVKGGNTDQLYQGDGRLKMSRMLERTWPGIVETVRKYQRPQHLIKNAWKNFDTRLKLKPGVDLSKLRPDEYGLRLVEVEDEEKVRP